MKLTRSRQGFTLVEVLVTLAILGALLAVLLPALAGQISKGDATRTANDVVALQTAIGAFSSDVKRYPGRVGHLTTAISASNTDINGVAYPSGLAEEWEGPYLTRETIGPAPGDSLRTGFGGMISGALLKRTYNGISYATIEIRNLTEDAFNDVDRLIDETASSSTGRLVVSGTFVTGTALYYAVPIQ